MRIARIICTAAFSLSAFAADSSLSVDDPYVRLAPPGVTTTGAFMTISNSGSADRKLVKAASPVSDKVQLHTHMNDHGVMKMREIPEIPVQANGKVELKPGSYHIMLIEMKTELKEGDHVPITLSFDDGSTSQVDATVRKLQMAMPAAHKMNPESMKK
jgi:copper(I)-binding protein